MMMMINMLMKTIWMMMKSVGMMMCRMIRMRMMKEMKLKKSNSISPDKLAVTASSRGCFGMIISLTLFLSLSPSLFLPVSLPVCLRVSLSVCLFVSLSISLSLYLALSFSSLCVSL